MYITPPSWGWIYSYFRNIIAEYGNLFTSPYDITPGFSATAVNTKDSPGTQHFSTNNTDFNDIYRFIHGFFHIVLFISTRPWYRPPWDDISRGLMTRAIWKRPCINLFITYFARADNMLLPFTRGQITCYFPRKMLLPRRQISRRKLCSHYTCKFGVISIKYVIILNIILKVTI